MIGRCQRFKPMLRTARRLLDTGQRHLASAAARVVATHINYDRNTKVLEVAFTDGTAARFSAELLRALSPSVDSTRKAVTGRRHVGIMKLEPVGNYAVRLHFDDLHSSGMYTWDYLHHLQHHRFSAAKAYLRRLREQGGSRDPPRRGLQQGASRSRQP